MFASSTFRRTRTNLALVVLLALGLFSGAGSAAFADSGGYAGAVYALTNETAGNGVAVFSRGADGVLTPAGTFATGGTGMGAALGSQGALILSRNGRWLFAVNAGSNSISAFAVSGNGLALADTVESGGIMPVSVTSYGDLVYVLNAGGTGNITGFRLDPSGALTPITDSTRPLSSSAAGGAQIQFTPAGNVLVVTEKATNTIDTYVMGPDGLAAGPNSFPSNGATPFGFDFGLSSNLFVTEAPGSAVSSYHVSADGVLDSISASVGDNQTAACWVAVTANGRFAFVANAASNSISSYGIAPSGTVSLLDATAGSLPQGSLPLDLGLSRDSQYLYQLAGAGHTVTGFRVNADGSLTQVGDSLNVVQGSVGLAAR